MTLLNLKWAVPVLTMIRDNHFAGLLDKKNARIPPTNTVQSGTCVE